MNAAKTSPTQTPPKETPMMQQYARIKTQYPNYLLFYRMGDFYEMFGNDAELASSILQITLTQRRSSKEVEGIPMCGVPYHAAEGYIAKLLNHGHKVALCEQSETPEEAKKRGGAKALVNRDVVRLYTGGTLTEDHLLSTTKANYLAAFAEHGGKYALAWMDIAGGTFDVTTVTPQTLGAELAAIDPSELLLAQPIAEFKDILSAYRTTCDAQFFNGAQTLEAAFHTPAQSLAARSLAAYVQHTQRGKVPPLPAPTVHSQQQFMRLDANTRQHLELTHTQQGEEKGSLFQCLNVCVTPAGSRLLRHWLTHPLAHLPRLLERQEAIHSLLQNPHVVDDIRAALNPLPDSARALARVGLERGSPRDLHALRTTLLALPDLQKQLKPVLNDTFLAQQADALAGFEELAHTLDKTLVADDIPLKASDGGFVQTGVDSTLDDARHLASNGLQLLKELEAKEQENTKIPTLKLKYNKVWGYYFELPKSQEDKVPSHFIHRQTTTQTHRYSTADLMTLERDFSAAEATALQREQHIFKTLCNSVIQVSVRLLGLMDALATFDVLACSAHLARTRDYVLPTLDASTTFEVHAGRHPVVEQTVDTFVANAASLSNGQLWLLTGPNMAGKSTFLRQNALIALMAHMGFPVPAKQAHIGLIDQIFTRIGAADDLAKGQSTFMLEMAETADILNHATAQSLVILDEMGRGTATFDGMSLAWACVEYLATTLNSRTLFATHYHELTTLAEAYETIHNHHVAVKEWKNDIVFLHQVQAGEAPGSYGLHVAKLAGVPKAVLTRATDVLTGLEEKNQTVGVDKKPLQTQKAMAELPLFTAADPHVVSSAPPAIPAEAQTLYEKVVEVDLDALSPREAQNLLYDLKIIAAMPKRENA